MQTSRGDRSDATDLPRPVPSRNRRGRPPARMMRLGPWPRRIGMALAGLLVLWAAGLAGRAAAAEVAGAVAACLTCSVAVSTIGDVDFRPWSLELTVRDVAIGPAPGACAAADAPGAAVRRRRRGLAVAPRAGRGSAGARRAAAAGRAHRAGPLRHRRPAGALRAAIRRRPAAPTSRRVSRCYNLQLRDASTELRRPAGAARAPGRRRCRSRCRSCRTCPRTST